MPSANDNRTSGTCPLVPVLLTGGCGVDLDRPVARAAQARLQRRPGGEDILHVVLQQLARRDGSTPPIVLTGPGGRRAMAGRLQAAGIAGAVTVEMTRPRGTAAAVAAAARVAEQRYGHCLLLVLPCDILARDLLTLGRPIVQGARLAEADGAATSIGIRPWAVGTGFDHLTIGRARGAGSYAASMLIASAGPQVARSLQASGAGYWNSGSYILPGGLLVAALSDHAAALLGGVDCALAGEDLAGDGIALAGAPLDDLPAADIEAVLAPCLMAGAVVAVSLGWNVQAGPRPGSQRAGGADRSRGGVDAARQRPVVERAEVHFAAHAGR